LLNSLSATLGLPGRDLIVIALVIAVQRAVGRLGVVAYALAVLPGTVAHEMAHYLVALLLRANPSFPSFAPRRTEKGGWRLGSVRMPDHPIRAVPIALAPLLLIPVALWLAARELPPRPLDGVYVAWAWVCSAVLSASLPSRQDWAVAAPFLVVVALAAAAVSYLRLHLGG